MALHLRRRFPILQNPNIIIINHFSSSSSSNTNLDEESTASPQSQPPSPMADYFSQVKASLKQPSSSPPRRQPPFLSSTDASQTASLQEIRKNLSEYRILTASPPPDSRRLSSPSPPLPQSSKPISFQELYQKRNQGDNNNNNQGGRISFEGVRESLKKLRPNQGGVSDRTTVRKDPFSLKGLQVDFATKPDVRKSSVVAQGTETVAQPNISIMEKTGSQESSGGVKNELVKIYKYEELGEKLRRLRPANAKPGQSWFSLSELNERLIKLREMEERESNKNIRGLKFGDLRESIQKLKVSDEEAEQKRKKSNIQLQNLNLLGHLGGTPSYMLSPPKEQLVEKYFHPDNMSSADKLKLELKKTRDEFKMSESDCGSSRVQVAQLTVKIKHLSSALHKKDKHSRKGLQEMVVRRKKLLKYLRRTDWDSYCFCLSKLGLRDNPDYKN
ncbi:hypothetical protein ACHQM5_009951 [Ranunculus cassubicifolius]